MLDCHKGLRNTQKRECLELSLPHAQHTNCHAFIFLPQTLKRTFSKIQHTRSLNTHLQLSERQLNFTVEVLWAPGWKAGLTLAPWLHLGVTKGACSGSGGTGDWFLSTCWGNTPFAHSPSPWYLGPKWSRHRRPLELTPILEANSSPFSASSPSPLQTLNLTLTGITIQEGKFWVGLRLSLQNA